MATKKSGQTKAKPKKAAKPKAEPKKKAVKKPVEEEHEHVHDESCGCCEPDPIEKNASRSYLLRDIWYDGLTQVIAEEKVPEDNQREMLFLTLSNAILDMVMDIVPIEMADVIAENIDDFLTVTIVNQQYDVDLLQQFKEDFVEAKGDTFEDEDELNEILAEFEEKWWNEPRTDLDGKSPNEALEEASKKYDL